MNLDASCPGACAVLKGFWYSQPLPKLMVVLSGLRLDLEIVPHNTF